MIRVKVKAKTLWPVSLRQEAVRAAKFAMAYYNLDCDITLKLVKLNEMAGYALYLDSGKLIIAISANPIECVYLTIFHEMTHVKQYVKGEIFVNNDDSIRWRGRTLNFDWDSWKEYASAPWEKEASEAENKLNTLWRKR